MSRPTSILIGVGVITAFLLPTVAAADDSGTTARGWKGDSGSNSSISAEVVSRASSPGRQMKRLADSAPRASRQGGFGQQLAGAVQQAIQRPIFDQLSTACLSTVSDGGPNTAGPCRSTDPADPADPDAATPAGGPAPEETVDARALAERAMSELSIKAPSLKTSPADPVKALVGLETWLWVPQGQWGNLSTSAAAGDTEVTVTARPIQTRWDMGEDTLNCPGPGREWRKGLGSNASTPCGYTYSKTSLRQPGKKYDVTAAIRYQVTFTCDGDCTEDGGDLGTLDSPTSTSELEVSERQSVVVR